MGSEISRDPDSSFQSLSRWLYECDSNHVVCSNSSKILPTRLIDVHPTRNEHECRLSETTAETGQYLALSYCWGTDQSTIATTTTANLADRFCGFNINSLPKTFQDAIHLTRKLGVKFLWIDALCIIQDNTSDWERESSTMCQVYRNAYLTLAATASSSGSGGLYAEIQKSASRSHIIPINSKGTSIEIHCRKYFKHRTLYSVNQREVDPLSTRAWAYQERLLSRRIVHFTSQELLWECRSHQRCECQAWDSDPKKELQTSFYSPAKGAFQQMERRSKVFSKTDKDPWHTIVEGYTSRHLTVLDDRLPAFSGIASAVIKSDDFLAGLRKHSFVRDLTWYATSPGYRPPKYRAPSWSWASVEAPIRFDIEGSSGPGSFCLTVLDSKCTLATPDPFGRLLSSRITIRSFYREADVIHSHPNVCFRDHPPEVSPKREDPRIAGFYPDTDISKLELPLKVTFLLLCRRVRRNEDVSWAMVVRRVGGEENVYERVGLGVISYAGKLLERTFTVI